MEQIKQRFPDGPSDEWVRLQFCPKTASKSRLLHHTGRFKLKFMVQQRHEHVDSHYAAASMHSMSHNYYAALFFRYMREYAIMLREFCTSRRQT